MKTYLLPETIRNAILAYLQEQKYSAVAGGIDMLLKLKEAQGPDLYEAQQTSPNLAVVEEGKG